MTQHVRNENGPRCANTEDRSEVQLDAGSSPNSIAHPSEPVSPRAKRFKQAEDDGIIATSRWIGHPAVREQIEWWRMRVHEILEPAFARILSEDPDGVIPFAWAIYGMSGINADFEPTNKEWGFRVYLTPREACIAPAAVRRFKRLVDKTAEGILAAGAPVDCAWDGDLVVIATLLLAAEECIPWDLPAADFAEWAYPPPSSAMTPDVKGVRSRRDVSLDSEFNVVTIRHAYEDHLRGPRTPAPYAGGKQRADREQDRIKAARIKALAEVKALYPDVTAGALLQNWGGGAGHPAHLYRTLIARELGKTWDGVRNLKPSVRSLERDHRTLGLRFQRKPTAN